MLDPQSLSQLRQLKQQLNDAIERAEGTVVAAQAQGRFGFVKLDDGRETFLPPEEMQRVFPGDRVQVRVLPATEADRPRGGKGRRRERPRAELEKLLDSPLEHFTGHYVTRGNAHFVVPDLPQLERWLFLPSQARGAARPGDLVRARILRHPFRSGRPQAEVIDRLGSPEEPFIEARYAAARWQLPAGAPEAPPLIQPALDERLDLTGLPLVTIDDPETMDLDDALHAVAHAEGWTLWVAIADPLPWLAAEPGLQKLAADRLGSIYLPGVEYPMLPTSLAHGEAALQADRPRPALVCEIDLAPDGDIRRHQWHRALVRPRARHSYEELADELTRADSSSPLATLAAAAAALRSHRLEHSASMAERPDYHLQLNEAGRLQDIQRRYKTEAHQLVEEFMLAANRCAAAHLAADRGLFVTHGGFRPERLGDVRNLTGEYLPELAGADPQSLEGYQAIMRAAATAEAPRPLRAIFSRWLQRSRLSPRPAPHFGLGLERYTTVTAPLRRYNDLLVQQLLSEPGGSAPDQAVLERIHTHWERSRRARALAEQWLKIDWLTDRHRAEPELELEAEVVRIHHRGASVQLLDSGIEGALELGRSKPAFRFDARVLELSNGSRTLQLEQRLRVRIHRIDPRQHSVQLAPVDDGGP